MADLGLKLSEIEYAKRLVAAVADGDAVMSDDTGNVTFVSLDLAVRCIAIAHGAGMVEGARAHH